MLVFMHHSNAQKNVPNALMTNNLVLYDVVPLDTIFFKNFSYAKKFYGQLYFKIKLIDELAFKTLIVSKLQSTAFNLYKKQPEYLISIDPPVKEELISIDDVKDALGYKKQIILVENDSGEMLEKELIRQPDAVEFGAIVFYDKWFFDAQMFRFYKDVSAYSIVRMYARDFDAGPEYYYKKIGFLTFNEIKKKREEKRLKKNIKSIGRVEYEFPIVNQDMIFFQNESEMYTENINSPCWTSYSRMQLRNMLIDRALKGKSDAFDFYTGQKLNRSQIEIRLGQRKRDIVIVDVENGNEKTIEINDEINPDEIKSVIFIEDWYFDEKSLRIVKKVIGIAPVLYVNKSEQEGEFTKTIPYVLYFN